jgi:hypothetical protein
MKNLFCLLLLCCTLGVYCQDKLLAFGYTKNIINPDSSNIGISIDLNRVPGKVEKSGGYMLVNEEIGTSNSSFYVKPTADINVGSATTSLPNNISIGLPFGLTWYIPKFSKGLFNASIEFSSDIVADKSLDKYLYYFSPGLTLFYSFVAKKDNTTIDFGLGGYYSSGTRQQDIKTKVKNAYQKFSVPISLGISTFKNQVKDFFRVKISASYKYNDVFKDERLITPNNDNNYINLKLDYFFIKKLGLNFSFNSGYEEPLFKKVKSWSIGFTLAR